MKDSQILPGLLFKTCLNYESRGLDIYPAAFHQLAKSVQSSRMQFDRAFHRHVQDENLETTGKYGRHGGRPVALYRVTALGKLRWKHRFEELAELTKRMSERGFFTIDSLTDSIETMRH